MYAKTLFYNGKPHDGFDTIKQCMTRYPLDAALALCANQRTLLTKLFPFLTQEDDMARR